VGCFFWRGRIDIKSCAPLEPGHFGELRHDLKMPVVVIVIPFWKGRGMDDVIVGRVVEHLMQTVKGLRKDLSGLCIERGFRMLETGVVGFGEDPCLKGKPGSERSDGEKILILGDDAVSLMKLLSNNVAKDTPVFVAKVILGPFDLFAHPLWNDGKGDDLGMGMFQRSASSDPMVFKDKDITESLVTPQIDHALAVGPKNVLHAL